MSSNIRVNRICHFCKTEFVAKTTVTKYCSDNCAKRAYKERKRNEKIVQSNDQTISIQLSPLKELESKEFLTVKEAAFLLSLSVRTTYRLIDSGTIKAVNLSERMTRIKRSELDKIL